MDVNEKGFEDMGWINLAQNEVEWWILANKVM
jgi:hypothetical protein